MIQLHSIDVRVYYEDTDAGGIVYYANYLRFFERARSDWLRAQGVDHQRLAAQNGLALVVRRCAIEYHRPARLDDLLAVDTCLTDPALDIRRASIRLQHRARNRADGSLLVSGPVQIACVELATMRPAPLPDEVFNRLRSHAMSLPADPGTP
ncbi:MAG: tol-pal system-associated acyl-CoA thioesterase [Lautropia sp.]|uniref:Tol-pal system-associated acyl-CoA thioesterase n=1 Tax=Lautropia dentalis TaxID=2490857 RepID=A0A3R8NAY2_9BURK|nr:tol-pal system-associated acyl-CoA thioesterase [Lautropia dentalis]RKW39579.1 MAG: tol-pal system-associated acyl-CoA thioesterase [Lautropia sp.]RRN44407.1 tol-pal system-associated acyl-CoA thioesterase [Lautropia dentalis]